MIKKLADKNYFSTSDLSLCVTLCYYKYSIEKINRSNASKVVFLIKKDNKLDDIIRDFWNHRLNVEPLAFFNLIKEVKNRIYFNK